MKIEENEKLRTLYLNNPGPKPGKSTEESDDEDESMYDEEDDEEEEDEDFDDDDEMEEFDVAGKYSKDLILDVYEYMKAC